MGYTEILQMVNSDPSVSLNEKIEYIVNIINFGNNFLFLNYLKFVFLALHNTKYPN